MSFASRFKSKVTGSSSTLVTAPAPVPVEDKPVAPRTLLAKNENGFIPTKFGEDIPDARKTFLPRKDVGAVAAPEKVDVMNTDMFPSLGGPSAPAPAPAVKKQLGGWATKAKEWAEEDARRAAEEDADAWA